MSVFPRFRSGAAPAGCTRRARRLKIPALGLRGVRNNWQGGGRVHGGTSRIVFHFLPLTEELEVQQSTALLPTGPKTVAVYSLLLNCLDWPQRCRTVSPALQMRNVSGKKQTKSCADWF